MLAKNSNEQSSLGVYDRDASRSAYGAKRYKCESVTIIEKSSGMIYEFERPWFGNMLLEHDGVRTMVEITWLWGKRVFLTYEPVSLQFQH